MSRSDIVRISSIRGAAGASLENLKSQIRESRFINRRARGVESLAGFELGFEKNVYWKHA
jgi:hypothetical protein